MIARKYGMRSSRSGSRPFHGQCIRDVSSGRKDVNAQMWALRRGPEGRYGTGRRFRNWGVWECGD